MPSLTLEQVKKAGRFAILDVGTDGFVAVYVPEEGILGWPPYAPEAAARVAEGEDVRDGYGTPVDIDGPDCFGWHHLSGCDCEFCGAAS